MRIVVPESQPIRSVDMIGIRRPTPYVIGVFAVLALLVLSSCRPHDPIEPGSLRVSTIQLMPPGDSASVFEPFVAVDPENLNKIVVGAQYGEGYNRGGLRFWIWNSNDGGESWTSKVARHFHTPGMTMVPLIEERNDGAGIQEDAQWRPLFANSFHVFRIGRQIAGTLNRSDQMFDPIQKRIL